MRRLPSRDLALPDVAGSLTDRSVRSATADATQGKVIGREEYIPTTISSSEVYARETIPNMLDCHEH